MRPSLAPVAGIVALVTLSEVSLDSRIVGDQQQAIRTVLDLQRTYDTARLRREPVSELLADAFVEIQADGRVLPRSAAIEKYTRVDDVSAQHLSDHWTFSQGDIVVLAGQTGEEGAQYPARRLYVWGKLAGSWRLVVFHKTFVRSPAELRSPFASEWPAELSDQASVAVEETFATRDPALLSRVIADDAMFVDGYGDLLTGRIWLERANRAARMPTRLQHFKLLYEGDILVVIGNEITMPTAPQNRFTRVWARSSRGMELRVSQSTLVAAEAAPRGR